MSPSEQIDLLGGTNAVARLAQVRPPSVSEWRKAGIPPDKLMLLAAELERRSNGALRRQALFPDTWHRIWPELIGTESATPLPEETRDAA